MHSSDYRDYVIRDGRFIGAFEEMYQGCDDPWNQDSVQPFAEDVALLLIADRQYRRVLDLGCGKGRLTARLREVTAASAIALDISETAIGHARRRRSGARFAVACIPPLPFRDGCFDLVLSSELLWYILPRLEETLGEISRVLVPGGELLVIQHFYQPAEQRYGNDVLQQPDDLLPIVPLQLERSIDIDVRTNRKFVGLWRKR